MKEVSNTPTSSKDQITISTVWEKIESHGEDLSLSYSLSIKHDKINVYRNKTTPYGHIKIRDNESYYLKHDNEETGIIRKYPAWTVPEEITWLVDNIYIQTKKELYKYTKSAIKKGFVEVFMDQPKFVLLFRDVLLASEIEKSK